MKNKEQHEKDIVKVIKGNKIMRIQHIFPFYPDLKSAQFYNLELEKSESIKEAIALNKSTTVNFLLNKWIDSDNPTLQISAFKVICDDEERKKLSLQYVESENNHQIKKFEVEIIGSNNQDKN
jgi:hypothetical protein